jgi:sulfur carrier protein
VTASLHVEVNGRAAELPAGTDLAGALAALGWDPAASGFAVAVNGEVVPRRTWPSTALAEADKVEVVGAVQGG